MSRISGAPEGHRYSSPGQRSLRPTPWVNGPQIYFPFSCFAPAQAGAKQEKGRVHYRIDTQGGASLCPGLLSFCPFGAQSRRDEFLPAGFGGLDSRSDLRWRAGYIDVRCYCGSLAKIVRNCGLFIKPFTMSGLQGKMLHSFWRCQKIHRPAEKSEIRIPAPHRKSGIQSPKSEINPKVEPAEIVAAWGCRPMIVGAM